jgi:RNA polymerase sigma-70 factor (ECF subfamily)
MAATEMTELLLRVSRGDKTAEADLLPRVYRELHGIARRYLAGERREHTLQATALVNEAYLRLFAEQDIEWKSRAHFFGLAAQTMRRILVDHARQRKAKKRGGGVHISLDEELTISDDQCDLITDLDEALLRLGEFAPRAARIVELRFFSGLGEKEIADILELSVRTVKRDWKMARAWLYDELSA